MENFIVSARKYRPQNFDEVVGQQHVTNTLYNAIEKNHLAQALLFTGPRGVGKTTCARILARMINTEDGADPKQDFSFNIFELDAASNNSVDDIRNLIDQVRFAPQAGNYKVYIIDEVHMLSQAAFNAFLKTLEEPPKHAIFILATTEKHKIIPTILSRCQIFDFKRIAVEDISNHLKKVAEQEGITAENEALHIIAQKADGALRDALSIFDRIVSFSGNNITYKDVIDNLRILDYDYYFRTTDFLLQNNTAGLLNIFDEILDNGFDGHLFINGLASHFRDLLVCKDPATLNLLEVGENTRKRYLEQSGATDDLFLLRALKLLAECDVRYKSSNNPRLLVELCLLQTAQLLTGENSREKKKPEHQPVDPPVKAVEKATPVPQKPAIKENTHKPESKKPETETLAKEIDKSATDQPVPVLNNKLKTKKSRFSISNTLMGKLEEKMVEEEQEDYTAPRPDMPKDDFNDNRLANLWQEYLLMLKKLQKKRLFSSLANKKLVLKENYTVEITLDNETQFSLFEEEKPQLLKFLREKLNNFSLVFDIKVAESAKSLEPYSPQEKFQYMAEKNPHLLELKQRLDLDLE